MKSKSNSRKLGEVSEIYSGYAFRSGDMTTSGLPVLKIANIQGKRVLNVCKDHLPEKLFEKKLAKYVLQQSDTLVAMTGAGSVGKFGKMPKIKGMYLVNQRVGIIRPNPDLADGGYLYYVLIQDHYEKQLYALGLGAGQPNISAKQIGGLEIFLPSLPTQRKIAGILSAYDDLIENNLRRIKILEQMAQSLYREWFVHFRFPGHESAGFIDSELGQIPKGWKVVKLGDIADQMRRGVPKGELDSPVRYVGLEHIPRQSIVLDAWEETTELGSNKLAFQRGDVLFGKIRPYFHKVSVAPFEGICSADTIVIRAKRPDYWALVTACVFTEAFVGHAAATSNGSKMPRTDWKVLKDYPHVLPPKDLLGRFSTPFESVIEQQQNLVSRNQILRRTRDLLLPQLLAFK
jgi:type I restriction enzyme, S subunit